MSPSKKSIEQQNWISQLLEWYRGTDRELPWRQDRSLYRVWTSEIMLQQTQVATVIPFFERWMHRFPTMQSVVGASEDEIFQLWQGLGYYRRCRNLLKGFHQIINIPEDQLRTWTRKDWEKISSIGPYTAGAILSIVYHQFESLVDGNVVRVMARITADSSGFGLLEKQASGWTSDQMRWVEQLKEDPGDWNQALMQLGQLVCRPKQPLCQSCPVISECQSQKFGIQDQVPAPKSRQSIVMVSWVVEFHVRDGKVGMRLAEPMQWWDGLWVLPYREERPEDADQLSLASLTFSVTHHRVSARVIEGTALNADLTFYHPDELERLPIAAPFRKMLRQLLAS